MKRLISILLCFILVMMGTFEVKAENANCEEIPLFEMRLVGEPDILSGDYFQEIKEQSGDVYLNELYTDISLGSVAILSVVSTIDKEYEYKFIENVGEEKVLLSEGNNSELRLNFDSIGEKSYEVQILEGDVVLETKNIKLNIQAEAENVEKNETEEITDYVEDGGTAETNEIIEESAETVEGKTEVESIEDTEKIVNSKGKENKGLTGTLTSSKTTVEYVNRGVTLKANVTGGDGAIEYQFSEYYDGKTEIVQEYSGKNTYNFSTKEIGTHTYYVDVKDGRGKTLRLTYTMVVVLQPGYEMAGTLTSSKSTSEYENRGVTLTANMTNGYGEYRYEFSETYNGKTETVQKGEQNTYSFQTKGIGEHTYTVVITDKAGQQMELKYTMKVYEEPEAKLSGTLTSSRTTKEYVNRGVILTANAIGGNGELKYQFSEHYDGKTEIVQEYGSKNTYSFSTKGLGTHTYYVDVKDGRGKTLRLTYTMTVIAHPDYAITVNLSSNKTATEYVNRSVVITATALGGYDKNYTYQFSETYDGVTRILQEFSADNTYSFSTEKIGTHYYTVTVKDGQNQTGTASYTMVVKAHPDYEMKVSLTSDKTTNEYSNRSIMLTAVVTGGYGDYQYQFVRVYEGGSKIVRDYADSNQYSFKTGVPGNYIYYVNVKDKANSVTQASYFMTVISDGNIFKGIDVSAYQGNINWAQVNGAGIDFAMLRVIENKMGALAVDSKFYQNASGATANGISIGAYRYGYAMNVSEARTEAYAVVNALKASGCTFNYPIAYDMEDWDTQGTLSMGERTAILKAFKAVIEENGYSFMIYASRSWLETMIDMNEFAGEDIWVAEYRDYTPDLGHQYKGPGRVTIWQYSSMGQVPGIAGNVDMNVGYMKY